MKYCPFCGVVLVGDAILFCIECGKDISFISARKKTFVADLKRLVEKKQPKIDQTSSEPSKQKKERKYRSTRKKSQSKTAAPEAEESSIQINDGYDGYYDDVLPPDILNKNDGVDPELIKRIFVISGAAVGIIVISILIMQYL